jgi:hypothetical protein
MTAGQLVQKNAQITYYKFDLENECSDMNYLWLNLKGYGDHCGHHLHLHMQPVPTYRHFVLKCQC